MPSPSVEARPEIDRANNRVAFVLQAEPSRRAYVRRINIAGNNRTRDEVVRREFRQFESSWYDADRIKLSRDRVDRLGYFTDVNVETSDVPGRARPGRPEHQRGRKAHRQPAVGRGLLERRKAGAVVLDQAGERVRLAATTWAWRSTPASTTARIVFNSVNPYFTTDGISRTLRRVLPHRRGRTKTRAATTSWSTAGAGLRFGMPFSEVDTVFFGGSVERTEIEPGTNIPAAYLAYAERVRLHQLRNAADRRLGARRPRQRHRAHQRALAAAGRGNRAWPAMPATSAATTSTSSTSR